MPKKINAGKDLQIQTTWNIDCIRCGASHKVWIAMPKVKGAKTAKSFQGTKLLDLNEVVENKKISRRNDICSFLEKVIVPRLGAEKQAKIKELTDKGIAIDRACGMCGVKISCVR